MSTTNESIRTKLSEAIKEARVIIGMEQADTEPLIEIAGQAIDALHDIDAMAEHRFGCQRNGIDIDNCVKCRVEQALA